MDIRPGDVPATWPDIALLKRLMGYAPKTGVRTGAEKFVEMVSGVLQGDVSLGTVITPCRLAHIPLYA